jgi:hypothetical protein
VVRNSFSIVLIAAIVCGVNACKTPGDEPEAAQVASATAEPKPAAEAPAKKAKPPRPKGPGATQSWEDPRGGEWRYFTKKLSWDEASEKCDLLAKQTKRRWRLPSPEDLQQAIRDGMSSSRNPNFGWVYLSHTWSSAWETALGNRVAIYVDMKSGRQLRTGTDHALTVLCIRTDDPLTKDMWADEKGSLMWRYLPGFVDWGTADRLCRNLARVDRMPWRLPTMSEIDLAHKHGIQGETNSSFGRDFLSYIWSSEVETAYGSEAYAHDLRTGNHFLMTRDTKLQNLCVRPQNY